MPVARRRSPLLALGLAVALGAARPTEPMPVDDERVLTQLIASGEASEALERLAPILAVYPNDCAPYRLAVEAARRAGDLDDLERRWRDSLRERRNDPFLLVGYALALGAARRDARARNIFSHAVATASPCPAAYEGFVRALQSEGRLREAANVLITHGRVAPDGGAPALQYGRGLLYDADGDGERALAAYRAAMRHPEAPALAHLHGALILERSGEHERALEWVEDGLRVAERDGPYALVPRLLGMRSGLWYRLRDPQEGIALMRRAVALAAADPSSVVNLYMRHAYLASARGDDELAVSLTERAAGVDLAGARDELAAGAHYRIGRARLSVSNFDAARVSMTQSLTFARRSGDAFALWDAHMGLAQVELVEGVPQRALQMMAPILDASLALDDAERHVEALEIAATVYERVGRFDRALGLYRLALRSAEMQRDASRRALTLGNLAIVEMRLGLEAAALAHAEDAARLAPVARDQRLETGLLQSLGAALAGAGRLAEARSVYERALVSAETLKAPELRGLIHTGLGRVLLGLAEPSRADEQFRTALDGSTSRLVRLQALSGLGLADWRQGELVDALRWFEDSLDLVESSRQSLTTDEDRMRYHETRFTIYANLAGVLGDLATRDRDSSYARRAFDVIERSRARALLDVVRGRRRDGMSPRLQSFARARVDPSKTLDEDEVLFEYALGEERSTLWVITRHELERFSLPPRRQIERAVVEYLETIRSPPRAPSNPIDLHRTGSESLYRMLVEPAAAFLGPSAHVIVAPHGILHHLPFETLGRPGRRDGEDALTYLVEEHIVRYVPSLSVLAGLRERSPKTRAAGLDLLGFAQSDGAPGLLPSIPFADDEVDAAARAFAPGRFALVRGAEANEARLKRELGQPHAVMHIAAHARADRVRPERSAIFVGADSSGREDGALTMKEVSALTVASDVVVLSGCETGLGQLMEIEGTLGFTWAFLSSGASTVAVTLWSVNDRASAELMETFYAGVGAGRSPAEALADAKREMLASTRRAYRHPYFWAPMVTVGLDRPLPVLLSAR